MRITILTLGTEGDLRPFLGLGTGLQRAGCRVCIASNAEFAAMVGAAGLDFAPLGGSFRDLMAGEGGGLARGLDPLAVARLARRGLRAMAESWAEDGRAACGGADLLIGSGIATLLAASLGEALGIPHVQAQLLPMTPAPDLPPMMLTPPRRPLPGPVNLGLYHALRLATWQVMRPAIDGVRARLGLRPYPPWGPYFRPRAERGPVLYGFSRHVVPKPSRWTEAEIVTGYWFYDEGHTYRPAPELAAFLAAGPKPIYVGFGSMPEGDAADLSARVLEALAQSGARAILATGWGGLAPLAAPNPGIMVIEGAPHDWLFPQVALAVHHGGAGTTAAAVRTGIPSVVTPVFGDQPFWGRRLQDLGVAPKPLPRRTLTADALAAAIVAAGDPAMRDRAGRLGEAVRAEDGVANAIAALAATGHLPAPSRTDNGRASEPWRRASRPAPPLGAGAVRQ